MDYNMILLLKLERGQLTLKCMYKIFIYVKYIYRLQQVLASDYRVCGLKLRLSNSTFVQR